MPATRPGKLFAAIVIAGASIAGGGGCASSTGATDARQDGADTDAWWAVIRADAPPADAWWTGIRPADVPTTDTWWTGIRPVDDRDAGDAGDATPQDGADDAGSDGAADAWWTGIRPATDT